MFGQPQASPFGSPPAPGGFGAAPAFGSPAPAAPFGAPAPGGFGAPAAPAFGSPAPAAPFGAPAPAAGGFGAPSTGFGAAPSTGFGGGGTFGAPAPAFGSTGGFGAQTNQSPFGAPASAPSGGLFGSAPAPSGGLFGAPAPSTGFGAAPSTGFGGGGGFGAPAASTGFGAPAPSTGFGAPAPSTGLFGAPAPAPAFGAPAGGFGAAPAPAFGAPAPAAGGIFGASPAPAAGGMFGAAPVAQGGAGGTKAVQFTPTTRQDGTSSIHMQSISAMQQYEQKSFEELRYEDYMQGNKGSGNAAGAGGFGGASTFGSPAAAPGGGLFGAPAPSAFGAPAPSAFGTPATSAFGAPAPGAFGAPAPAAGAFGAPAPGAFGAPAPGAFGSPAPAPGAFGAPAPGAFGAPAPGAFGAPTPAPGGFGSTFGTPPASNLFGGGAPAPAPGGLFGSAPAPPPAFGAPSPAPGLFGASSAPAPGLFGAPAPSAFGAPAPSAFGAPAPSAFGAPAPSAFGGGAFGSPAPGMFGAPAPGAFGAPAGGSLFGSPPPAPGGMFGAPAPAGGMFGAPAPGAPAPGVYGAQMTQHPSAMMLPPTGSIIPQAANEVITLQIQALDNKRKEMDKLNAWRGKSPEASTVTPASQPQYDGGLSSVVMNNSQYSPYRPSPRSTAKIRPRGFGSAAPNGSASLTSPVLSKIGTGGRPMMSPDGYAASSVKRLVIKPDSMTPKPKMRLRLANSPANGDSKTHALPVPLDSASPSGKNNGMQNGSPSPMQTPRASSIPVYGRDTTPNAATPDSSRRTHPNGINGGKTIASLEKLAPPTDAGMDYYQKVVGSPDGTVPPTAPAATQPSSGRKRPSYLPKLSKPGYSVSPSIDMLAVMSEADLATLSGFSVRHEPFGMVEWDGAVDVRYADLDASIVISQNDVSVYTRDEEEGRKPPIGSKLNRPAVITFFNVFPKNGGADADEESKTKFAKKIERSTAKMEADLISYDKDHGIWKIRVHHFSRYGLDDSDEEDEEEKR